MIPGLVIEGVSIQYKYVEGWHIYQAEDMPGLYIASKDDELARQDVPVAIQKLRKLDAGIK